MARFARVVAAGYAHHVTQRGNHHQDVFFCDDDRRTYLTILRDHVERFRLRVLAWCLMSNHVHLVIIPEQEDSLALALGRTHGEYAHWIHVRQRQVGHLWQNRFHSCPLDEPHLWDAIRYVELNPARAGLVTKPADWPWSSASAHTGSSDRWNLTDLEWWCRSGRGNHWEQTLEVGFREAALLQRIREATQTGRPLGSISFVKTLETSTGRVLLPQKRGRKPALAAAATQTELVKA